ncbi:MAG: type I-E CRISPR-associated protein Cse2/CasB [Syntrophomonadaceae bacterium]|jgi:CRISPR system Cascade subunit CasB|nr:type I-E CRISPR-associated protein Cse2/CasB [Syntrophomonadaceae bacterium]
MGENQGNPAYQIKWLTQKKVQQLLMDSPWSKAMLAKLRRGIGKQPGELPELFEILFMDMPEELYGKGDEPSYAEWALYTSLTLFALHQQGKERPMSVGGIVDGKNIGKSFGAAIGTLVKQDKEREIAIKRRFDAVLTSNEFTEFAYHARSLIQLLKGGDIALDYPRFATELYWYQFEETRNRIRLRWGEDYYRIAHLNVKTDNTEKEKGGVS